MQDPDRMSDTVLSKAMGVHQRLVKGIEDLADFFAEYRRFLAEGHLERFIAFQNRNRLDRALVSLKRPITGLQLHVYVPGRDVTRVTVQPAPAFDSRELLGLLSQDVPLTD